MRDNLNKIATKYINGTKIEDITYESIKKAFSKSSANDYGKLSHHLINFEYNQEKVLKMLDELFKNGLDINAKGKNTGYTFLHLAFYGYTDTKDQDHSYSEEFILKLIDLAKKYHFNFNSKDNDGDTIIHSCIASEIYTGEIMPILNKVLDVFDLDSKDNNGYNIYEALLNYKKEAKGNNVWYTRLAKAEGTIKRIIELHNINIDEINANIDIMLKEIKEKINNLTIHNIQKESDNIDNKLALLKNFINSREQYYETNNYEDYNQIYRLYQQKITAIINSSLETLLVNPTKEGILLAETIINKYSLTKQNKELDIIKANYEEYISSLLNSIKSCNNINAIDATSDELASITDERIKAKIQELNITREELLAIILSINTTKEKINKIRIVTHQNVIVSEDNYQDKTKEELLNIDNEYQSELQNMQNSIYKFINYLINNDLIELDLKSPKTKKRS